jgi:hypothetical protein
VENVGGASKVKRQAGPRALLILGIGVTALVVGLVVGAAALVALGGSDGEGAAAAHPTPTQTVAATQSGIPTPTVAIVTAKPTATPIPTPVETPAPGTGGDQPGGTVPPTMGDIPENVNVSADILALKDQLAHEIADYAASTGTDVGISVTDIQTGETISVNGNVPHKTGCVINMFGLLAAVDEFAHGNATPSGLEYSIKKGIGGSYPPEVKNFLQEIYGYYPDGVQHARDLMNQWGMHMAWYDHIPYYGSENPPANVLTPLEVNRIFYKLWYDQLFDEYWSDYTIGVLRDSYAYVNYILPKFLPSAATVGHKIGYYWDYDGWVNNDVGIVSWTDPHGYTKAYAISYFSQYAPSEAAGYTFGQRLSLDAWNTMSARYGVYVPPVTPSPQPTPVPTPGPSVEPTPTQTVAPTASPTQPTPTIKPTKSPAPTFSPTH